MNSLIIPVYKNEGNVPSLLVELDKLSRCLPEALEVVFVVDGSPDASHTRLAEALARQHHKSQLILLARNFGSFAAIRAGLAAARGDCFAVMAADLQEPPELVESFFATLRSDEADVVVGQRLGRQDAWSTRLSSSLFWWLYCRVVSREIPEGGVDIFGCNRVFRDALLAMQESHSSLIGLLFWLGFRRKFIPYERRAREIGKSAWTLKKKLQYLSDSSFAFSNLPIRLLSFFGLLGVISSLLVAVVVLIAKVSGQIQVPGYTATILVVVFFAALNSLGLGIIGNYVWRAYENTKARPLTVVLNQKDFEGKMA